jgi:WD40 repeat protein
MAAKPFACVTVHTLAVVYVGVSPDGLRIVSCSRDKTAIVYTISQDGVLQASKTLAGHKDAVTSAAFSPKEKSVLATSSQDRSGIIWQYFFRG